ncbi:MAG: MotA/TolQ/ExbB proton channel family protein [Cytophagaceae bacterium]|nr:MotA/TolQ/ExbB proton channel family protein [Cytophagaceae bacterium]
MSQETNLNVPQKSNFASTFAAVVIPLSIVISILVYWLVLGDPANFNEKGEPIPGNFLGLIHAGGVIVPLLLSFFLMVLTFSIERFITIQAAYGNGSLNQFVRKVKSHLSSNDIDGAIEVSEAQRGSVGNVTTSVLTRYKHIANDSSLSKDKKVEELQKEVEDSTALELPHLEKNLNILATLASVGTLVALLGTVIGMIKAFTALSTSGTPNAEALASGISEALINTALGISVSAIAMIMYNFFNTRIDNLTHKIDEIGYTINRTFADNNK